MHDMVQGEIASQALSEGHPCVTLYLDFSPFGSALTLPLLWQCHGRLCLVTRYEGKQSIIVGADPCEVAQGCLPASTSVFHRQ